MAPRECCCELCDVCAGLSEGGPWAAPWLHSLGAVRARGAACSLFLDFVEAKSCIQGILPRGEEKSLALLTLKKNEGYQLEEMQTGWLLTVAVWG